MPSIRVPATNASKLCSVTRPVTTTQLKVVIACWVRIGEQSSCGRQAALGGAAAAAGSSGLLALGALPRVSTAHIALQRDRPPAAGRGAHGSAINAGGSPLCAQPMTDAQSARLPCCLHPASLRLLFNSSAQAAERLGPVALVPAALAPLTPIAHSPCLMHRPLAAWQRRHGRVPAAAAGSAAASALPGAQRAGAPAA